MIREYNAILSDAQANLEASLKWLKGGTSAPDDANGEPLAKMMRELIEYLKEAQLDAYQEPQTTEPAGPVSDLPALGWRPAGTGTVATGPGRAAVPPFVEGLADSYRRRRTTLASESPR